MQPANGARFLSRHAFELFLISLLSLYFELLIIRWLSSEIRIFAYFKNMALMACLFGLGLGLALTGSQRNWSKWFPAALALLTFIVCFAQPLNLVHVTFVDPVEHYLIGISERFNLSAAAFLLVGGLLVLTGVFYLIVFTFACLGQRLGQSFDRFPPLVAYSINVGASLLGILLFSAVSFLSWTPAAWLLLGIVAALFFYRRPLQVLLLSSSVVVAFITAQPNVIWSPYYRISVQDWWLPADGPYPPFRYGTTINVNHDFIEGALDNRIETLSKLSPRQRAATWEHYSTLYKLIGIKPRSVLILAAGAGNDVASALRHGATSVDAVEIDPVIVSMGKIFHVEKPYDDQRVHVSIDDARAFLRRTTKKYDLVDFAYLDSHAAFSSMSSVRLDNYVYTVESFRDAYRLLKPDGIMAVHFYGTKAWQTARIFKALTRAIGYEPTGVWTETGKHLIFLAGPGLDRSTITASGLLPFRKAQFQQICALEQAPWDSIEPSTDDWPYLFLRYRGVTFAYAAGLLCTLAVGLAFIKTVLKGGDPDPSSKTMFFLGAAFMLVEVKCVTQMGLLLGTTWLVNSAAIAGILLMILAANLCVLKFRTEDPSRLYVLVGISLVASYFLPLSVFNTLPLAARTIAGALVLSLPIALASGIFAVSFKHVRIPHSALAMNLLGTLAGGLLEYSSMIVGISALNLIAALLYCAAWFSWHRKPAAPVAPASGSGAAGT
jgi:SAM-dependent methyltransferase